MPSCLVCKCLMPLTPLAHCVNSLQSTGGQCSACCEHSVQCKTISHPFQFSLLMYFQLYRHLLCVVSSVWLVHLLLIFMASYLLQPFSSVSNIPSGLSNKAPISATASSKPGNFISRRSVDW